MNRRTAAILLITLGIALGDLAVLSQPVQARNTTTTTITQRPAVSCGALSCTGINHTGGQSVKGGSHGGGGVIKVGP